MSRGRLAVHAHFYQPERRDPFSGVLPPQAAAAPFRDWNARIDAECYRPNAERGNLERISFDLGPTLAAWLAAEDPPTLRGFVAADRPAGWPADAPRDGGNGMAQGYHHSILPLASLRDRRTEIRWGLRDFLLRFGRPALGLWLPETAVDVPTLRLLAEEGVGYTILAPWQAMDPDLDTRRPYRVELGGGRSIVVVFYDGGLSARASFDPDATADAERFAREYVAPRLAGGLPSDPQASPLTILATDGELYGHHQPFRDLFLERLVRPPATEPDRGFDVVPLALALVEPADRPFPVAKIRERTSWSCHHGVARWSAECPDAADGRWKGPLRAAMDRLAGGIDATAEGLVHVFAAEPDLWAARDAYVDIVHGAEPPAAFSARWLGDDAPAGERHAFVDLLEAQRWRLAMYASDGWFWDDPVRGETKHVLLCAARAARLMDALAGTSLEARFVEDLSLLGSPSRRVDGATIYHEALAEVGQPMP
ncbi:MAG TPA: DUF3536 domain-containing protein [Candidatus Limnocylindrales bacterium]